MYTLTNTEAKLPKALLALRNMPRVAGRCLGYVRAALSTIGLRLPPPQQPHSTALKCFEVLDKDPAAYGWQRAHTLSAHPILLCFYDRCGNETASDGTQIECGHVALRYEGTLYSSDNYADDAWWQGRLVGAFIPLETTP